MNGPSHLSASLSGTFLIGGDLPVHRLGYGTMRLVGDGAWGEPADEAEARRVLRRAVELGVTLIDTADAYGPEIAERLIGETLAPYPPGVVIATKGGITRQGPAKTEYVGRAGYLIQCVEMSLRRLNLERIDLYQLHRIDPRTPLEESLGALRACRSGKDSPHRPERSHSCRDRGGARRSFPSSLSRIDTRWPIAVTRKRSPSASAAASPSCRGIPFAGGKMLKPDHPPRKPLAVSRPRHESRFRSFRSPGCCSARQSCCPFPAHRRSHTWKRTSPLPRSISRKKSGARWKPRQNRFGCAPSEMMPPVRRYKHKQAQQQNHHEEDRGESHEQSPAARLPRVLICFALHRRSARNRISRTARLPMAQNAQALRCVPKGRIKL